MSKFWRQMALLLSHSQDASVDREWQINIPPAVAEGWYVGSSGGGKWVGVKMRNEGREQCFKLFVV
jgi:hypothetical protein